LKERDNPEKEKSFIFMYWKFLPWSDGRMVLRQMIPDKYDDERGEV
jgi:hypothetical protein